MERLETYQYLGLKRSGTKADMFTFLNVPTRHATAVQQVTIVVHDVTHTSTFMEHHITNIKNIDAVLDTYSQENILKALTHQQHGNDQRTRVGDGNTPVTNWNSGFVNNEEKKKLFSFSGPHISKAVMGGTLLLSIRFETLLSNKHCDLTAPQHCNVS